MKLYLAVLATLALMGVALIVHPSLLLRPCLSLAEKGGYAAEMCEPLTPHQPEEDEPGFDCSSMGNMRCSKD